MTNTRIDHTGHNHPSTTAARTACRKAMKATPSIFTATVGRSSARHLAVVADNGQLISVACGAGMQRGRRAASAYYTAPNVHTIEDVDCARCVKAHNNH